MEEICIYCGIYPLKESKDGKHIHLVPVDAASFKNIIGSIGDNSEPKNERSGK